MNSVGFGILAPELEDGKRKIPRKAMFNPAMISSVITIVLVITGFKWPAILSATLSSTGAVTSPVAMLIVGILIAGSSFKRIKGCDTELPTKAVALSTIGAFACVPLLVLFMSLV